MTQQKSMVMVPYETLYQFARAAFLAAGVREDVAHLTAEGLASTSLRGVDSHGIRLLPHYVRAAEGGRINKDPDFRFDQTSPSTAVLDADHAYGHAAGMTAMRKAIEMAKEAGTGFVSVKNSSHCGAMAYYGLEAAQQDMIGMAFTHATSKMRSPASARPFFGTNPMCFTAPMAGEDPFCFDSAPTPITSNRLKQYREDGEELPAGSAADPEGRETRNAQEAVMLLPIGDYKGFGWAAVVEVLCGMLTGMPFGHDISNMYEDPISEKRYLGHFFGAIRVDVFEDLDNFKQRMRAMADQVRSEPLRDPAIPSMLAGDKEKRFKAERTKTGIPVKPLDIQRFDELASRLQIDPIHRNGEPR